MRARTFVFLAAVSFVVLGTASPALAKGPDRATITGPGLAHPIVVGGNGEPGSADSLGQLSDGSGLFLVMFGPDGNIGPSLTSQAPPGQLGPKYELSYRVPDGSPTSAPVRQDLYPLADGGPVTYTKGGQAVFGTKTTAGWYRAPDTFSRLLAALGVPGVVVVTAQPSAAPVGVAAATAVGQPVRPARHTTSWMAIAGGVLAGCVVLAGVAIVFTRRRTLARP